MRPAVCTLQDAHLQGEMCLCQASGHSVQRLPQSLILPCAWQCPCCTWTQSRAPSQQADSTHMPPKHLIRLPGSRQLGQGAVFKCCM